MDLVQLRMFCCVADTGSLARAAEQLHRVPSNLTTRLRQLEEEIGVDLFIREKQRMRLSPMGHNFLNYARRILALSDEALNIARAGEPGGNFAFGSMESTAATRLPALLAAYHQRYPAVALSLGTGTSGDSGDKVRAGTLAAALVDGPAPYDDLNGCIAFSEEMVLISSPEHPPILSARDTQQDTLFAFGNSCSYRTRLESWYRDSQSAPRNVMEIQSYHAMVACVAGGGGVAMLPASVLAQMPARERVQEHALPPLYRDTATWLMWRRDAFTPNVEALKYLIIDMFDDRPQHDGLLHPLPDSEQTLLK